MIPGWVLLLVSAGYVCLLFAVAYAGDQRAPVGSRLRPLVYALALAVYCSSWTFYGAVGTAARVGLAFLPIYLGPLLLMLFGWRMLERLVLISGVLGRYTTSTPSSFRKSNLPFQSSPITKVST